ncbi:protein-tyrosine phosphatase-like protein [Phycomyces nitens]|nr:protein-tyrosine phosphatase-like protein [Phycomyces nitens]
MATPLFAPSSSGLMLRRNKKNLSLRLLPATVDMAPNTPRIGSTALQLIPEPESGAPNHYSNGPALILPNLYLGSEHNAANLDQLNALSIKYIINAAAEVGNANSHLFQPLDTLLATADTPYPTTPVSLSQPSLHTTLVNSVCQLAPVPVRSIIQPSIGYKKLQWTHNQENITGELNGLIGIIDRARSLGQSVLVHCQCGVARSATIIIGYVMKMMGLSMDKAYSFVKSQAPAISPNMHLIYQLQKYEQSLLLNPQPRLGFHESSLRSPTSASPTQHDKLRLRTTAGLPSGITKEKKNFRGPYSSRLAPKQSPLLANLSKRAFKTRPQTPVVDSFRFQDSWRPQERDEGMYAVC